VDVLRHDMGLNGSKERSQFMERAVQGRLVSVRAHRGPDASNQIKVLLQDCASHRSDLVVGRWG
jgi:hypothetical protein